MPSTVEAELGVLRAQIRRIDDEMIEMLARRTRLCVRIGGIKREAGLPLRHPDVERALFARARQEAVVRGLDPEIAESIIRLLIEQSIKKQTEIWPS